MKPVKASKRESVKKGAVNHSTSGAALPYAAWRSAVS
jgi:hypothetical protein